MSVGREAASPPARPAAEPPPRPAIAGRAWRVRAPILFACVSALLPVAWLDLAEPQLWLAPCWLAGMALYLLQWPLPRRSGLTRPSGRLLAALLAFAAALFVAFCLVYDNWRWAVTGDSLDFYTMGSALVHGRVNPFKIGGVFQQCTVTQAALQNMFMFVWESSFTHRLGNLLTSTLLVLAAARFAAQISSRTTAVLFGVFLPVHSGFVYFTMISYPNLSGVLPYYAACTLFLSAWRRPESGFLWAALGLTCGLAFYFLPLWGQGVGWACLGMVVVAVRRRTPRPLLIWAGGLLTALLPALTQFQTLVGLWTIFRSTEGQSLEYFRHMFTQCLLLPLGSEMQAYGTSGAWLPLPFGYLYPLGALLAALSGLLALTGWPRPPCLRHAWVWLVMFVLDAAALSLNNSGYGAISTKRAILLIPGMTFLMVLPLAWLMEQVRRPWFSIVLTTVSLVGYGYLNASLLQGRQFGYTAADGIVRMIQTAPTPVYLVTTSPGLQASFGPKALEFDALQEIYRVRDHTVLVDTIPTRRAEFGRTICFSEDRDGREWAERVRAAIRALCPANPVEYVTLQLECAVCDPA